VEQRIEARGRVVPTSYVRVSSLAPGRVSRLAVREGDEVFERQELVRVDTGADLALILAPMRGTVTALLFKVGESVAIGQAVATIADLSRFVIETTDVDEFTVARIKAGQGASVLVDALGDQPVPGRVASVGLMATNGALGDTSFPVRIEADLTDPRLRWGMTARVVFTSP
jgi:multidrug efflux pump subunit AcrA (membrane-fusion protein)